MAPSLWICRRCGLSFSGPSGVCPNPVCREDNAREPSVDDKVDRVGSRFTAWELARYAALAAALAGFAYFGGPPLVAALVSGAEGVAAPAAPALAAGIGLVAVGPATAGAPPDATPGERPPPVAPRPQLDLLGILEEPMSETRPRVVMDRRFGADRKLWSRWRGLANGAVIRIDDEEMELSGGGDVAREVGRGVNGTRARPHATGAEVYLVRAAER